MVNERANIRGGRYCRLKASRSCRGWTTVEVLVVLVLVLLLGALSSGAYQVAYSLGHQTRSAQRLRAMQMGNEAYANENNGFYVPAIAFAEGSGAMSLPWFCRPDYLKAMNLHGDSYHWESYPEELQASGEEASRLPYSFGYNVSGLSWGWGVPGRSWSHHRLRLKHPAKHMAFADSQDWLLHIEGANAYQDGVESYTVNAVAYRYQGKANVVFYDGHVEALSRDQVVGNRLLWIGRED